MNEPSVKKTFSRIGWAFLSFSLIQTVVVIIASVVFSVINPSIMENGWISVVMSYAALYFVAFPAMLLIIRKLPNAEAYPLEKRAISLGKMIMLIFACFGVVMAINLVFNFISNAVSSLLGIEASNPFATAISLSDTWVMFVVVVIIAPVMEELIFRRILYKKLIMFGDKTYIIVSALLFALFHSNIYQLFYAFVLGLVFAYLTSYSGTTVYSTILHFFVNLLGSGVGLIVGTYGSEDAINIWSYALLAIAGIGCIVAVIWYIRRRKNIVFRPGEIMARRKHIYVNSGMIAYIAVLLILSVISVFPSLFAS